MQRQHTCLLAAGLFIIFTAIYLLTYSGSFHSTDEMAMFAVTENIVKHARFNSDQIRWQTPFLYGESSYGLDGDQYSKKGPLLSLLAVPLYVWALVTPDIGLAQAAHLINIPITALLVVLVWAYSRRLGYSNTTAIIVAILYGTGTLAWPYAKYFFSEPLAGLGLFAAAYFLLYYRTNLSPLYGLLIGASLMASISTRVANALAVPPFVLWLLYYLHQRYGIGKPLMAALFSRKYLVAQLSLGLPLICGMVLIGWYNVIRFGNPLVTGYDAYEQFNTPLLAGLYGFVLSPGKSVILYCPILLVALLGLPLWIRLHRSEALLGAAICVPYIMLYSMWYIWWGGTDWGPRFLVPLLPFMIIPALPLVERIRTRPFPLALLGLLGVASAGVQVLGWAVDFNIYENQVRTIDPLAEATIMISDPRYSPIVGHFLLLRNTIWDLALLKITPEGVAFLSGIAWTIAGLLLFGVLGLLLARRRRIPAFIPAVYSSVALLAVLVIANNALHAYQGDLRYGPAQIHTQMLNYIATRMHADDLLVLNTPVYTPWMLNNNRLPLESYGLSKEQPLTQRTEALLSHLIDRKQTIWFPIEYTPEGDRSSTVETYLSEHAYRVDQVWFGNELRLVRFDVPDIRAGEEHKADVTLGGQIRLDGYSIHIAQLGSGSRLYISLHWERIAQQVTPADDTVFIQLLDTHNTIIAQRDAKPVDGLEPTNTWNYGAQIRDNYAITLQAGIADGQYRIIAGTYDPVTGKRLAALDGGQRLQDDAVVLGKIDFPLTK